MYLAVEVKDIPEGTRRAINHSPGALYEKAVIIIVKNAIFSGILAQLS
jgi:hypothetical protein